MVHDAGCIPVGGIGPEIGVIAGIGAGHTELATRQPLLAHSDLLAMLPIQWSEFPMTRDTLQVVRVREALPAPAIVLIRRPDLPLTPAVEFFCDVLRRHGPQG